MQFTYGLHAHVIGCNFEVIPLEFSCDNMPLLDPPILESRGNVEPLNYIRITI